jgi:hypothetical protein
MREKKKKPLGQAIRRNQCDEVARLAVLGMNCPQIRDALSKSTKKEISVYWIREIFKDARTQDKIAALGAARDGDVVAIRNSIEGMAPEALETIRQSLTDKKVPWPVRSASAKYVLDVIGVKPKDELSGSEGLVRFFSQMKRMAFDPNIDLVSLAGRDSPQIEYREAEEAVLTPTNGNGTHNIRDLLGGEDE